MPMKSLELQSSSWAKQAEILATYYKGREEKKKPSESRAYQIVKKAICSVEQDHKALFRNTRY